MTKKAAPASASKAKKPRKIKEEAIKTAPAVPLSQMLTQALMTLIPERDASGLSDSGLCLRIQGSPDIKSPITAEIKLPRRRPQKRKLVPTKDGRADAGELDNELDAALGSAGQSEVADEGEQGVL